MTYDQIKFSGFPGPYNTFWCTWGLQVRMQIIKLVKILGHNGWICYIYIYNPIV